MTGELLRQDIIDLKYVAKAINEVVGSKYRVLVNGRTTIAKDDIIDICLHATRIPFAITGIGSETLDVSMEIYVSISNDRQRDEILSELNVLIGHRSGIIDTGNIVYNYASFFEFGRPLTAPIIDMGKWMQLYNISGTMLLSNAQSGAVISNDITTKLYLGADKLTAISGFIPTLSVESDLNYGSESMASCNDNMPDVMQLLQSATISINALILNRELENTLLKIILLCDINSGIDKVVWLQRYYPTFMIEKKCKILGGSITECSGAYAQYSLSLQEIR